MFHSRRLVEGEPGTVDNFQLSVGISQGDFYSPRHRHNFEQIRVGLEGTLDFGRDGKLMPGIVGYFPEGVYYGPQTQNPTEAAGAAVLQFGGASGSGYLSNSETRAAMAELNKVGEFKNGVFRARDRFFGKKNVDGNQAIWEQHHQRKLGFPKPRYPQPIFMDTRNYAWVPSEDQPGVYEKLLGVFTERKSLAEVIKLDPGATYRAKGHGVFLVFHGAGTVEGQPLRALTTVYLKRGEAATFAATAATEIMHYGLPNLAGVKLLETGADDSDDEVPAEAAE
jgi:hypothetical protein